MEDIDGVHRIRGGMKVRVDRLANRVFLTLELRDEYEAMLVEDKMEHDLKSRRYVAVFI